MVFLFLIVISQIFCFDNNAENYNLSANNNTCSNKDEICSFNISYNYTKSPKIPTSIPSYAILGDYRYIYLRFIIPKTQIEKTFYLEAFDISNEETIISNGDCYFINTSLNIDYEIRIYKQLKTDSYIQFGFLGFSNNFTMKVELRFPLSLSLYFNDIALTYYNSLNKSDIPSLRENFDERDNITNQQNSRRKKLKETCSKIMKDVFSISLDMTLFDDNYFNSIKIPNPPFFLLTLSYMIAQNITTDINLKPENKVLSETTIKKGKIDSHKNSLDFLKGKLLINNDIYRIVELYNTRITEMAFKFGNDSDFFLIISTNEDNNFIIYSLGYYYNKTKTINYEIQIKIQFINAKLKELVIKTFESYINIPFRRIDSERDTCNMSSMGKKIRDFIGGLITSIGISYIYLYKPEIIILYPVLSQTTYTAKVGAFFLQMKPDNNGIYHADFDCWQQYFGYTKFYDFVFDIFTDMECNNEGIFTFNGENYILWGWKGDYINLGAGAELGIYYGGKSKDSIWKVNKSLAMPMTLTLTHKIYGTIVDNWDNWGNDSWWITAFNPHYKRVKAKDLTAYFTVKFKDEEMFDEFSKIDREGWSYNKTNKIASLIL